MLRSVDLLCFLHGFNKTIHVTEGRMLASPVLMAGNFRTVLLWVLTKRSVLGWQTFRENISLSSVLKELWVQGQEEVIRVRMLFTGWPHSVPVAYPVEQGQDEVIRVRMWFTGWPHPVPVAYAIEQGQDEVIRVRMWFTGWPHPVPVAYTVELFSQRINYSVHFDPVPSTSKTEEACSSETSSLPSNTAV